MKQDRSRELRSGTVCLTFDFDALSAWLQNGATSPGMLSRGEYGGRVGARRVLDVLDRYRIPATFFIPGHTIDTFPDIVREIVDRGHEIGHHGYLHENPASYGDDVAGERAMFLKGIEAIERASGSRPLGYRSPGGEALGKNTISILESLGFLYDSSLEADDFSCYFARSGDIPHLDRAAHFGEPSGIVEVPVSWHLDDFPQFEFVSRPNFVCNTLANPSKVLEIWSGDLDFMVQRVADGVITIQMHPEVIGRGHRILMLEQFIDHCLEYPDVKFRQVQEVAINFQASRCGPDLP